MHNVIPCICILANHHISTTGQCSVCKVGAEYIGHALFKFERPREVWRDLGLHENIKDVMRADVYGAHVLEFLLCDIAHQYTYMEPIQF